VTYTGGFVGEDRKCAHNFGGELATWTTEKELDLKKIRYGDGRWVGLAQNHAH
jgi:hypothetical protein